MWLFVYRKRERERERRFCPCVFFYARSAARQQLAKTNQLMNSLVERASLSLSLFSALRLSTSTFLFFLSISPLLLMAQPLCPTIHSGPVNSGAKRHPAVVVNAVKRYKASSRVSIGKQQQIPTVSPAAHGFYFTILAPLPNAPHFYMSVISISAESIVR